MAMVMVIAATIVVLKQERLKGTVVMVMSVVVARCGKTLRIRGDLTTIYSRTQFKNR